MFDKWYKRIYDAGYNARALEDASDQNRRLQDMLKYGKELGKHEGFIEGYKDGYKVGYSEGEQDTMARVGELDLEKIMQEVEDEYTGFKGLVNEEGVVDDVSEVMEAEA